VIPPADSTYNRLAVSWWQWALGQPNPNPLVDPTGARCTAGQSGPVFFLAGVLGSGPVTRQCTVPPGKRLFFPLFNGFAAEPQDTPHVVNTVYQEFQAGNFAVTSLSASVDGKAIGNLGPRYLACALPQAGCTPPSFSVTLPTNNVFGAPAGVYTTVQKGYYLLLAPLPPGEHTIHFTASGYYNGDVLQDVTYRLTVAP
jgi:hypothetical protein